MSTQLHSQLAKDTLKSAEKTSISDSSNPYNAAKTAQDALQPVSLYHPTPRAAKLYTRLKQPKKGPLFFFLTFVVGFFFFLSSASSFLGVQIHELITNITDTQHVSRSLRQPFLTKKLLSHQSSADSDSFHSLPTKLQERFHKQGIETGFVDSNGQFVSGEPPANTPYSLKTKNQIISASDYETSFNTNPEFRDVAQKSTHGRAANFYDASAEQHFKKTGLTRNDFANFKQSSNADTDLKQYRGVMNQKFATDSDVHANIVEDQETTDENGKPVTKRLPSGEDASVAATTGADASAKAKTYLDHLSSKTQTANFGCMALKIGNMVSTAIASLETYQSIHFFMSIAENISKMKAGIGQGTAMHPIMNFFQTSTENSIFDVSSQKTIKTSGTPLESAGLKSVLGNVPVDTAVTKNYSSERASSTISHTPALSSTSLQTCSANQAVGAVVSLAPLAIPGGGLIKLSVGFLKNTVLAIGTQIAIAGTLALLIPTVAEVMFSNRFDQATGKPAGELFTKGAIAANAKLARSASGQTPASPANTLAFHNFADTVNTLDTEIAKLHTSPFDLTSPYSFFGHLLSQFSTIHYRATSSPFTSISTINHLAQTSLTHTVLARDHHNNLLTTFSEDCQRLQSIGAAGDPYCNASSVSDPSTLRLDPDDPTYRKILAPNLTTNQSSNTPTETIKPNSNLANFILYCAERDSPFGAIDANIQNSLQHSLGVIGDNLPVLNDIVDIVNAAEDLENLPWATGAICVNSAKNPRWNSEFKYYQRYIEDNRILEQFGAYQESKNPVIAFKETHELAHPTDHSPAGTLARLTGFTKYDAENIIALYQYSQDLQLYHPTTAYQFQPHPSIFSILHSTFSHLPPFHHLISSTISPLPRPPLLSKIFSSGITL